MRCDVAENLNWLNAKYGVYAVLVNHDIRFGARSGVGIKKIGYQFWK